MKRLAGIGVSALLAGALVYGQNRAQSPLVITASNASANQLLVYSSTGSLLQTVATRGQGGASGNAGGIAVRENRMAAVVNFGSKSVSVFQRAGNGFRLGQVISTASSPVSVAFGHDHLYILGTANVESHQIFGFGINSNPDGVVPLFKADGSAAQVGVLPHSLIISEKSNTIETVQLDGGGAVEGSATLVSDIPANVDTPFGLVTRGDNAYVTIAHADEISLVRNGMVLTTTGSGTQHSPCWVALDGPFLFSSNSPSKSISRYAVYGRNIIQDAAVAATLNGSPTDIAHRAGLVAVIDGAGQLSHLSIFDVDEDGNLTLKGSASISGSINGVAVVGQPQ